MRRNPDKIREIALATEALEAGETLDFSDPESCAHVEWMRDAGLVDAQVLKSMGGVCGAIVIRLTWDGCDFLDAARSDTLWEKAKSLIITPTASWTFDILKEWLKAEIKNGIPSLRGLT